MKNVIIVILSVLLYIQWRRKTQETRKPAAITAAPSGGVGSGLPAPAAVTLETHKDGLEVLRLHGNIKDRGNNQRLSADISTDDAQGLSIGDTVHLDQSNIYSGFYKIMDIVDGGNIKGIVLDTHYLGAESGTYLSTEKTYVSGFSGTATKKSAFR